MEGKNLLNSNLYVNNYKIFNFDTSSKEIKYRIVSKTCDIEINENVKKLLDFIKKKEGQTATAIIDEYSKSIEDKEKIKSIIEVLNKKGILSNKKTKYEKITEKDFFRNKMENLILRIRLIDTSKHNKFFKSLSFILRKHFVIMNLVLFFIVEILFIFFYFFTAWGKNLTYYSSYDYLYLVILSTLMLFFHEIGHVAAANKFNVNTGDIGIGIYYYLFVAFSDVHESWNLTRNKRKIVSISGLYFSIIFMIPIYFICYFTKSAALFDYILLFHLGVISILNPFLKMDGYWFLCDALGVPNLQTKLRDYIKYIGKKIFNRVDAKNPFIKYPVRIRRIINLYFSIFIVFMVIFLFLFFLKAIKIGLNLRTEIFNPAHLLIDSFYTHVKYYNLTNTLNRLIRRSAIFGGVAAISIKYLWKLVRILFRKGKKQQNI